jgi:FkbM family methyltransferase
MKTNFSRIERLIRLLQIDRGVYLKLREPAFSLTDFETCKLLKAADVQPTLILDAGANVGQFALAAAHILQPKKIICFEPVEAAYQKLRELQKRYAIIEPRKLALGSKSGKTKIKVTNLTLSSSLLPLHANHLQAYPHVFHAHDEEVQVSTLLAEMPSPLPKDTLLKIDVQGYELEVLRGAGDLRSIRWVLAECASKPYYEGSPTFQDILNHLQPLGFHFQSPISIHRTEHDGAPQQFDILFSRDSKD